MKATFLHYLVLFSAPVLALAVSGTVSAEVLTGTVTRVWDGDTITLDTGGQEHRIRLTGIDAPEYDQPWGDESRLHLERLLLGKPVRVESEKADRYGRLLGKVWVRPIDCPACGKTLDANLAMLTVGAAWWYRYYKDDQPPEDQGRYEFAEFEAKSKRAGLWRDPGAVAPWDWPRGTNKQADAPDGCRIKGNISDNGRIYHLPGQRYYDATKITPSRGERWFCSESEARAAGWRRARN